MAYRARLHLSPSMEPVKTVEEPIDMEPIQLHIRWQCAALILDEYFQTI